MSAAHKLRLDDQLCFALYAATNAINRVYRPMLEALGLTYPQYLLLMVLWEHGAQTSGAIARYLDLPPNAVTPLVSRLVALRLVKRKVDPKDGRSYSVVLTQTGAALESDASRAQSVVADSTRLSHRDFVDLRRRLHSLTDRFREGPLAHRQ